MVYVGVDGCRSGWFAAIDQHCNVTTRVYETFASLLGDLGHAERICIDIPIGLPSKENPVRFCDQQARAILKRRRSSVFSPPCRAAANAGSVSKARELNIRELGKSLSEQAWGICRKIAEVDFELRRHPHFITTVVEVHPELCFWALGKGQPMRFTKGNREGHIERIELLAKNDLVMRDVFERERKKYKRTDVQDDDIVDALVALATARMPTENLCRIPSGTQCDSLGLPMQMLHQRLDCPTPA